MTEKKKFFILGKVFHQDDTNPIELLSERDDEVAVSKEVSRLMNENFPPKNIFIIEGVRRDIHIKDVSLK